ncbi:hypothetical protein ACJX0J_019669, partial [Zea mays]
MIIIHDNSEILGSSIFFNTSMLGLVTSSNLMQIYFFGNLGFCLEFRDLFKIANNWIPNNGINSLLTTFTFLYSHMLNSDLIFSVVDIIRDSATAGFGLLRKQEKWFIERSNLIIFSSVYLFI